MRERKKLMLFFISLTSCFAGCESYWGKFRADQQNSGYIDTVSTAEGKSFWSVNIDSPVGSAAIDSTGRIFISGGNNVYVFDPSGYGKCVRSIGGTINVGPTVSGPRQIIFGSEDGYLYTMETSHCQIVSSYKASGPIKTAPLLVGGNAIFASYDGNVYSVDLATRQASWHESIGAPVSSSPAYVPTTRFIVVGSDDEYLYAFDRDYGKAGGSGRDWGYWAKGKITAPPAVGWLGGEHTQFGRANYTNMIVIVANHLGGPATLHGLGERGHGAWQRDTVDRTFISGGAAITPDHKVFFGTQSGDVYCLDLQTGGLIWRKQTGGSYLGSPAVSSNGIIYIGGGHTLYAIFATNGTIKWTFPTAGILPTESSPAIGPDGTVYVGDSTGNFYAIR